MMFKKTFTPIILFIACLLSAPVFASPSETEILRAELDKLRQSYEGRITALEQKLSKLEREKQLATTATTDAVATQTNVANSSTQPQSSMSSNTFDSGSARDNSFNPKIGVTLNAQYNQFSSNEGEIAGFASGHEGERPREGFAVDHTELSLGANVDDKFVADTTIAVAQHEGETELELEEAYVETLPGAGLPNGMSIKAGRSFWTFGYLNEHHSHADDFADRPLPYRAFLNEVFNDDGIQVSYLLPTSSYAEIGAGAFQGDDFPFGEADGEGIGAWSAFARIGNDIGANQSWRLGAYVLSGEAHGQRSSNEDELLFTGDTDIYATDFRYTWAPTGNARERELTLQGEYFWRDEDGQYQDTANGTGEVDIDDDSQGWYAQAVYKFHPQWRIGGRYSQLKAADVAPGLLGSVLDDQGHDPKSYSAMLDWSNSEFSRIRLQFNREELGRDQDDNQIMLQYIMSFGAHPAHKF